MSDPVLKAMEAARISLLFLAPDLVARLTRLRLKQADVVHSELTIAGGELVFGRDYVKSLTAAALRERLLEIALLNVVEAGNELSDNCDMTPSGIDLGMPRFK